MTEPNMWWIVANDRDPEHGWHWDQHFNNPSDPDRTFNWGGPSWTRSAVSFTRIEEMRRGDIVAAYQAGDGIVGLARPASDGYKSPETDKFDTFDLAPSPAVRFNKPVPYEAIRDLLGSKDLFEFVRIAKQGSVFRVSVPEERRLLQLAQEFNPPQAPLINQLMSAA